MGANGDLPSEADAVEDGIGAVFWKTYIKELNEGKLAKSTVCGNEELLCEAEERDELGDPNTGAEAGIV